MGEIVGLPLTVPAIQEVIQETMLVDSFCSWGNYLIDFHGRNHTRISLECKPKNPM